MRTSLAVTCLLAVLPSCIEPDLDHRDQEITGGALVASNVAPFDAVFRISANGSFCTATKIGSRRLLTAAHCVRDLALAPGVSLRASNDLDTTTIYSTSTVARAWQHPTYLNPDQGLDKSRDVGVIELESPIEPAVAALALRAGHVGDGASGVVVGYGCDEDAPEHKRFKQRAATRAMSLAQILDYDRWTDTFATRILTANVLHDNAANGTTACDGDSGGPILYNEGGVWRIGAVTRGHNGDITWRPRTSGLERWIASPGQDDFRAGQSGMLLNKAGDLCLGVPGASTAADVQLAQYVCDGRAGTVDNQRWELKLITRNYFQIRNGKSGKCIGVAGGSTATGARIAQYDCDNLTTTDKNQAWKFQTDGRGSSRIVNGKSDKCLAADDAGTVIDARMELAPCAAADDGQSWNLVR